MNAHPLRLSGVELHALPSGALWVPEHGLLCVSDLHLGKAERMARRGNGLLPPYDSADTLQRLFQAVETLEPVTVVCLGDSFDDLAAADGLAETDRLRLIRLMAGRDWIWIEGNHDPGPLELGGRHLAEYRCDTLTFRHIALHGPVMGEISGHYHPKATVGAKGRRVRRPCFLTDGNRLILPAFGTFTGGLDCTDPAIRNLLLPEAMAILTGPTPVCFPVDVAAQGLRT